MLENIDIKQAKDILLNEKIILEFKEVNILDSLDYVLAEDIESTINVPPFNRSPLDGYALKSEDIKFATKDNPIVLDVIDNIQAGYISSKIIENGQAIRIMTGAKIPEGADIVIKYEDTDFTDENVKIYEYLKPDSNIVKKGEDIEVGDIVLKKGKLITPADIGIMASLGISKIKVYTKPKIALIATGDELVDINESLQDGKIRNSNSYMLAAQIKKMGAEPIILNICKDNIEEIKSRLLSTIDNVHMVITTGGVSVGDADLVKDAFVDIGGKMLFWKVQMKPGTPIAVAKFKDKFLFGLSGNPAAASITFELFVRPVILKMMGKNKDNLLKVKSTLESSFDKISNQNRYVRAITSYKDGQFFTILPEKHSSGVLSSLSQSNSLFFIKANDGPYKEGDEIEVELLEGIEKI